MVSSTISKSTMFILPNNLPFLSIKAITYLP
jgi:hypothetical protein